MSLVIGVVSLLLGREAEVRHREVEGWGSSAERPRQREQPWN